MFFLGDMCLSNRTTSLSITQEYLILQCGLFRYIQYSLKSLRSRGQYLFKFTFLIETWSMLISTGFILLVHLKILLQLTNNNAISIYQS